MAKKRQKKLPLEVGILREGAISGVFAGIAKVVGFSVDEESHYLMILEQLCEVTENGAGHLNCTGLLFLLVILILLTMIYSVLTEVRKVKNMKIGKYVISGFVVGLMIYGVGFLAGFLFIVLSM